MLLKPEECVTVAGAVVRAFIAHGDRTNRAKARLKYVLDRMGRDAFLAEVEKEYGAPLRRAAGASCSRRGRWPTSTAMSACIRQKQAGPQLSRRRAAGRPHHLRADARPGRDRRALRQRHAPAHGLAEPPDLRRRRHGCRRLHRRAGTRSASASRRAPSAAAWSPAPAMPAASSPPPTPRAMRCGSPTISRCACAVDLPINIHLTGCHHSCAQHYVGDIGLLACKVERTARTASRAITSISAAARPRPPSRRWRASMRRDVAFDELPPLLEKLLGGLARPSRRPGRKLLRVLPPPRGRGPARAGGARAGPRAGGMSVRTTCPYCGVGCGVLATPDGRGGAAIAGDPEHPANRGRLCSKGAALGETLSLEDRLLHPEIDGQRVSLGDGARHRRQRLSRDHRRARARCRRLLRLGPAPDRGLLRRQQADEGLPRHRQHRHQLAAVHGLVGGRPQARLRQRHRARHLRGFRAGRSRRAGRQQSRLVPSRAVPAARSGQARAAGDEDRGDRSAPHRDLRHRRSPSRAEARQRRGAVQRPAGALQRRGAVASDFVDAHTTGLEAALAAAQAERRRSQCDLPAGRRRDAFSTGSRAPSRRSRSIQQGVNQSSAGIDKVNAHHQLPPADRPHRPAGHGAVLDHRPAQRDGRPRGRRAGQHAGRPHGFRRRPTSIGSAASGARRAWPTKPGLKAVDLFEAVGRGEIKAVWIMATNPVVSLPNADAVRDALRPASSSSSPSAIRATDTVDACRMSACRRSPGARRTAPSPIPSAASRASGRSCRAPGEARPDWWIVSQVARRLGFGEAFAWTGVGRDLPRACGPVGLRERRRARFRHRRLRRHRRRGLSRRSSPFGWGGGPLLRRRRLLPRRPARALRRDRAARSGPRARYRAAAAAQHRPRARPVAHHDAHRKVGAARRPSARADGRAASARCCGARHRRRCHRARSKAAGAMRCCARI